MAAASGRVAHGRAVKEFPMNLRMISPGKLRRTGGKCHPAPSHRWRVAKEMPGEREGRTIENMRSHRLSTALFLSVLLVAASAGAVPAHDVLGVSHAAGKYNFTGEDFLNEGADRLLELGTRVIKVWFDPNATPLYPFNADWGAPPEELVDLARHPFYQELFAKPFSTYLLVVSRRVPTVNFLDGMTVEELAAERREMYDLARYLLTTYEGTGKTFVLQNWEGDHLLRRGLAAGEAPDPTRLRGMAMWWNARQSGVTQARRDVRAQGVTVAHAVEVNLLRDAMEGKVTAANDVVPLTRADLYSYSSWDIGFDPAELTRALDYLAAKAPDSSLFGARNVYLGEFGAAKDQIGEDRDRAAVIRELADAALGWGARWAVYWQLYCNEPAREYTTKRPLNRDLRGFWLIRPDGVKTPMYTHLLAQLGTSLHRAHLRGSAGRWVMPEEGAVTVSAARPTPQSALVFRDIDGGRLRSGDLVRLLTHQGTYLREGEDGRVLADTRQEESATTFVIRRSGDERRGILRSGDSLVLESPSGQLLGAGSDGQLRALGEGETFNLLFAE